MAGDAWHTVEELQAAGLLLVEDGNHGENRPRREEFAITGTAFIRAADMSDGRVDFTRCEHISDVALARIRKGIGRPGDILLSHKGTVGKLARLPKDAPSFVCSPQTTFWRVLNEKRLDRGYLYAFMRSSLFANQLASVQGETDMAPYVSLTAQRRLRISIPSLPKQISVGLLLGALDDKIDLNRRLAETFEAIARALFQSWFVDFDPIRAKADGRPTGLPGDLAALFPNSLGADGLPTGWRSCKLGEVIELAYGKSLTAESRRAGTVPVYGSNGQVGVHDLALVAGPGIVIGRKGNPGTVTYVAQQFFPIDTTFYVIPRRGMPISFLKFLLKNASLESRSADSAVPGLSRDAAYSVEVGEPPAHIVTAFDSFASLLEKRAGTTREENDTLSALRDTLLPKLISGELRIADAEQRIAAA